MAFTTYASNKLIDHFTNVSAWTVPTTFYLALYTSAPSYDGSGTEVTGGGYNREVIAFNAASSRTADNAAQVLFDQATADWGTITHWAIYDSVTGGNMLFWGSFDSSETVIAGNAFRVNANGLSLTLA